MSSWNRIPCISLHRHQLICVQQWIPEFTMALRGRLVTPCGSESWVWIKAWRVISQRWVTVGKLNTSRKREDEARMLYNYCLHEVDKWTCVLFQWWERSEENGRDSLQLAGTTDRKYANNLVSITVTDDCTVQEDSVEQKKLQQHQSTQGSSRQTSWLRTL